jgi:uncharacterized membrane protein SirB2
VDYLILKAAHVTAVALSGAGFIARGLGQFAGARWVASRAARTLPHVVDTVLLASAVGLACSLPLSLVRTPWLVAKIAGLFVYIALGTVALRFARTRKARITAWAAALLVFGYIVSVAITKDPRGLLALRSSIQYEGSAPDCVESGRERVVVRKCVDCSRCARPFGLAPPYDSDG